MTPEQLEARFNAERQGDLQGRARARACRCGGLSVIGTERHESRRIDNQLRGRPAVRATPARPSSTCRSRTTSCACSAARWIASPT